MPIGPSLPPHLAHLVARSSSPEDEPGPTPPGPSLPAPAPAAAPVDDDEEEDYVPALPPHLLAARQAKGAIGPSAPGPVAGPSLPSAGPVGPRPLGPSLPGAGPSRPPGPAPGPGPAYPDEDSDDEVIGPMPVPSLSGEAEDGSDAVREFMEREERRRKEAEEKDRPVVKKRDEWMLVPPTAGVLSNVDPLRKRPTTFSRSAAPSEAPDTTLWTETPAEKAQRIADEVAGVKRKKDKAGERVVTYEEEEEERRKRRREADIRSGVERHTQAQRGPSLLDQHAASLAKKKKDGKDDAPAIWDHDRDMGVTGRLLSDQERSGKIKEARGLGDRFGHGKSGAYQM
ncbi:hypothetical protein IAT38_003713 [Cryptococcus sp. DSM 104549]